MRAVAAMGYDGVELAGYAGRTPEDLAGLLREMGLEAAGVHAGFGELERDPAGQIEACRTVGAPYLILAGLPRERLVDLDFSARFLEEIGRRCREADVHFAYHNHDAEFAPLEGRPLLEALLERTDGELVGLELDVYWAAHAGVDPHGFLATHGDRIPLLHLKDMDRDGAWTEVGDGTLDLLRLYREAAKPRVRWCIVEHDEPRLPALESPRRSLQNLRGTL